MRAIAATLLALALAWLPQRSVAEDREATNRNVVLEFYEQGLNQKNAEAALRHLAPTYVQHSPHVADGREGFKEYVDFLRRQYPQARSVIKRVIADDDYVVVHVHSVRVPGELGSAIVDIFRLERGKIVEHWASVQPVPENPKHPNGMF